MKFNAVFLLLLFCSFVAAFSQTSASVFNRALFYEAIASKDLVKVDHQLSLLSKASIPEKEGFEGALLMKKADLINGLKEKLAVFKEGNLKLEKAIKEEPKNIEFRFLRLIIQENAPKILNYNDQIKDDAGFVKQGYKSAPSEAKKAIADYDKKSENLNLTQTSVAAE